MKAVTALGLACGILIALASAHAWSQTSETSAASHGSVMAAPGATTAKATRQANRALRREVYAAIVKHKEIDAGNISVIAKEGAVTLDGTVADASQIDKVTGRERRNWGDVRDQQVGCQEAVWRPVMRAW